MPEGPRVLIVDDDPAIRRLLGRELKAAGYSARELQPGQGALAGVAQEQFDVLLLDIDAPASGGTDTIRVIREHSRILVVALSARSDEDATVAALDSGADDYIRKPFGTRELLARVRNTLRRQASEEGKPSPLVSGDLEVDLLRRRVRLGGRNVYLAVKAYAVLRVLAENAGKAISHEELLGSVWGARGAGRVPYLRVAIRELRLKLEPDPANPHYIVTEPRVGYRLEIHERIKKLGPNNNTRTAGRDAV